MYKIGYIEGYDSFNTISFVSKQAQSLYFDNHTILTIDEYYPPYYTNIIKLSRNDLDYTTTKFNFVTLIFNNERYYYFVTGINYVNEDVYEILITMDTIQTIMFELYIDNGVQIRECINRWNGNEINREYQRENVSKDDFMIKSFEYRYEKKFLVLLTSKSFGQPNDYPTNLVDTNNRVLGSGIWIYVFPILGLNDTLEAVNPKVYIDDVEYYSGVSFQTDIPYNNLLSNPYVINMFVSSAPYLKQLMDYTFYKDSNNNYRLDLTDNLNSIVKTSNFRYNYGTEDEPSYTNYLGFPVTSLKLGFELDTQKSIRINNKLVTKNTNTNVLFDEKFIPQLIDENYIQISYGEKLGSTSFPLNMLRDTTIRLYSTYDLISNARAYKITPDTVNAFDYEDAYNTIVASQSVESFNLINDAWETYQATHKGSLTTGLQLQVANNIYKFASSSAMGMTNVVPQSITNTHKAILDLGTGKSRETTTVGDMRVTTSHSRANNRFTTSDSVHEYFGNVKGATAKSDFAMDMINTVANYQITKENMMYTPDIVGQGSNLYADTSTKSYTCFYQIQEVTDIVACARKLEYYGYAVNKVINKKYINELKTRYYYNIIQATNLTIVNKGERMIPLELIHDFVQRLESGIRLFDIRSNDKFLDNLKYDNVEIEVITNE